MLEVQNLENISAFSTEPRWLEKTSAHYLVQTCSKSRVKYSSLFEILSSATLNISEVGDRWHEKHSLEFRLFFFFFFLIKKTHINIDSWLFARCVLSFGRFRSNLHKTSRVQRNVVPNMWTKWMNNQDSPHNRCFLKVLLLLKLTFINNFVFFH